MIWNYFNLRFENKTESDSVLFDTIEGEKSPRYTNLDVIGLIYHEESPDSPEEGWYVNIAVQGDLPLELEPYSIPFPDQPKRVWFTTEEEVTL